LHAAAGARAAHGRPAVQKDALTGRELEAAPAEPGCGEFARPVVDLGRHDRHARAEFGDAHDSRDRNLFV
jgi:hypothetical protein